MKLLQSLALVLTLMLPASAFATNYYAALQPSRTIPSTGGWNTYHVSFCSNFVTATNSPYSITYMYMTDGTIVVVANAFYTLSSSACTSGALVGILVPALYNSSTDNFGFLPSALPGFTYGVSGLTIFHQ